MGGTVRKRAEIIILFVSARKLLDCLEKVSITATDTISSANTVWTSYETPLSKLTWKTAEKYYFGHYVNCKLFPLLESSERINKIEWKNNWEEYLGKTTNNLEEWLGYKAKKND